MGYTYGVGIVIESHLAINASPGTITHEFGHYFGLRHTFEGSSSSSCADNDNCLYDGDGVCDTDPVKENITCSPDAINVCTNLPLNTLGVNYMSYSCDELFTQGQKDRMLNALQDLRPTLLTSLGGSPPSTVASSISIATQNTTICPNQPVTLSSNITNGGYTPDYQWYVNNIAVEQTYSSLPSYTYYPSNNDVAYCKFTSSLICAYPQEINSNSITFIVEDIPTSISFSTNNTNLCQDTQVTMVIEGVGFTNATYEWYRNGILSLTSTTPFFQFVPNNNDTLYCRAIIDDDSCREGTSLYTSLLTFTVGTQPVQPIIISITDYLKVTNYNNGQGQWYTYNGGIGVPIPGATNKKYYPTSSGVYYFLVNNNGCSNQSEDINFTYLSTERIDNVTNLSIYPNPIQNYINICKVSQRC